MAKYNYLISTPTGYFSAKFKYEDKIFPPIFDATFKGATRYPNWELANYVARTRYKLEKFEIVVEIDHEDEGDEL